MMDRFAYEATRYSYVYSFWLFVWSSSPSLNTKT